MSATTTIQKTSCAGRLKKRREPSDMRS